MTNQETMIKAVFFDIGGTIHTQKATPECDLSYAQRLWRFLEQHGIRTADAPELLLESINKGAREYKSFSEAELIELNPDEIWQRFMLKDFSIPAEKIEGLGEDLCFMFDRYRKEITRRAGLEEMLQELKRLGYRLGVISNIMSRTFVPRILEEYKISEYFEAVVLSSVCGIRKPRPEIFDIALKETGLKRDEVAYVGDTVSRDVIGVRNACWRLIIQIDNPLTYHKDKKYTGVDFEPDIRIKELTEVVDAVERYNNKLKEEI